MSKPRIINKSNNKGRSNLKLSPKDLINVAKLVGQATKGAYNMYKTVTKTQKKTKKTVVPPQNPSYKGSVRPTKKKVDNSFNLDGVVFRQESNGIIDSPQCQYLGHSTIAPRILLDNMCRMLVKEVSHQTGRFIQNWDEVIGQHGALIYAYFVRDTGLGLSTDEDPTINTRTVTLVPADTFNTFAEKIASDIHVTFNSHLKHEFIYVEYQNVAPGVAVTDNVKIYMNQFYVTVAGASYLKFQNTTLARTEEQVEDDPDDSAENIQANPLSFKMYQSDFQNGMSYTFKRGVTGATTKFNFVPNDVNAVITFDPTDTSYTALYKPPSASAMGMKVGGQMYKQKSGTLDPGDIKTSYLTYQKKFPWNQLFNLLSDTYGNTYNWIVKLGNSRVFAFEHLLKVTGDPNIRISYQHDLTMKMKYYYKPKIVSESIVSIV